MGLTVVELHIVPVDEVADALVNLEIAPSAPLVGREPEGIVIGCSVLPAPKRLTMGQRLSGGHKSEVKVHP